MDPVATDPKAPRLWSKRRHTGALLWATALLLLPASACDAPDPGVEAARSYTDQELRSVHADDGEALRVEHAAVAAADELSSRVGAEIMRNGGNAVDAAIGVGFALAVTHPAAGNIGGGGFMVVRTPEGESTVFDFREKAPLAAHDEMFLDEEGEPSSRLRHWSHTAVGVPGTVAGFELAHQRFGTVDWAELVDPAVELADEGFQVMPGLARSLENTLLSHARDRGYEATIEAFSDGGEPYAEGDLWRQPDLARTFERIRDQGRDGFYRGETADLLVAEMERGDGLITHEDLERYEAVEREPVVGEFRGHEIVGMAPPSSGGTVTVQALNILEGFDLAELGHNTPEYLHHLAEALRLAWRDRAQHLADSDFWDVPVERLTSKDYAAELRERIDPSRAGSSSVDDVVFSPEGTSTTHYSVVDPDGMAVSVTYTLERSYGSRIAVPGAGFLLNNEMGDFNPGRNLTSEGGNIGTEPNLARPEQRMLSSMSPTVFSADGELAGLVGSPGGRTIINTVIQLLLNRIEFGMEAEDVVEAGRIHHQWLPDRVTVERRLADDGLVEALEAMGHEVGTRGTQGRAHSIFVEPAGGLAAMPDGRGPDAAAVGF